MNTRKYSVEARSIDRLKYRHKYKSYSFGFRTKFEHEWWRRYWLMAAAPVMRVLFTWSNGLIFRTFIAWFCFAARSCFFCIISTITWEFHWKQYEKFQRTYII